MPPRPCSVTIIGAFVPAFTFDDTNSAYGISSFVSAKRCIRIWTRGSTGPEVGAYFKGHVKRNGVGPTYWTLCRVTACEPEAVFEFAVGPDEVNVNNWGYRLEPRDGGTLVTEYFRLGSNLPTRAYWLLLGPLRRRTNKAGMRTTLERMKAVVEQ